ncbi:MAG: 4Fe-4S dicluster domain-containing protein [Peptococcaceae bacterium]|nr:4Fe-4S dicluster domain-containing protein [Peptococcaceae bacterium]
MERRTLFKASAGGLLFLLLGQGAKTLVSQPSPLIRPPGTTSENHFLATCLRCGQCAQVCPCDALLLAGLETGLSAGTPYIVPRQQPCDLCMECLNVCPTGAIVPVEKEEAGMGLAVLDQDRCITWHGDVCKCCYARCPFFNKGIVLEDFARPVVDPEVCVGCGICEYVCILDPPAITIVKGE